MELKGYLYQVNDLVGIKSRVDNILLKIKNNKNNVQYQYEECLENINEEFTELIEELNSQKIKSFSIFYKLQMISFLEGKYKYYRINITNDEISESENNHLKIKRIEESKRLKLSNVNDYKSISKISREKDIKRKFQDENKIIQKGRELIINKDSKLFNTEKLDKADAKIDNEKYEMSSNNNQIENSSENDEKEQNDKNKKNRINKTSTILSQSEIGSNLNKIKIKVMNKADITPVRLMRYLSLLFIIIAIICFIYNYILIDKYFNDMSFFCESNLIFNMTKMSVAIIYIMVVNIKWELHHCLLPNPYSLSEIFENLTRVNVKYLLNYRNKTLYFGKEFKDILEKRYSFKLNVYGFEEYEYYDFNFDNIVNYIVNGGINIIKMHAPLLKISENSEHNLNPLSFGYNEIIDLQNKTYLYFNSDINGFMGKEKNSKIQKISNVLPLIINSMIILSLLILFIYCILKINYIEIFFLDNLINFSTVNFDGYLKNLDEIRKKLQNDNQIEEEKEDMDINDLNSKENENIENQELKENKVNNQKKAKKDQNKAGKAIKQKKNKLKIMSSFFSKKNCFLGIEIIFIMIISLSYYIVSIIMELNKKKEFLEFDRINNDMISVFKESFDIFMIFKKELADFEDRLDNCNVGNKELYKMNIPSIDEIAFPNFGNNIMQIVGDFGFKGELLEKFQYLFNENACKSLDLTAYGYYMCANYFGEILFQGMEQSISKINSLFGTIIEEMNGINANGQKFLEYMNLSTFHRFEIFIMYYYQRAILLTEDIFNNFRVQELNNILFLLKFTLIIYIIVTGVLFLFITYLVYKTKHIANLFLYFIGILPFKYLLEDEKFYHEIIKFGDNYFY